jgi:hypothetical protein
MADTLKTLYKGTLGTGSATLYAVPASTTTIVKEIILCNKTASATTASIAFDGGNIVAAKSIPANETLVIELHSILETTKIITGMAGTASAIDVFVSGIEVA